MEAFLHNFFCPSVKLIAKERIGSKTIKRYNSPRTPYQRIMDSPHIKKSVQGFLSKQLENLNPLCSRKTMDKKLKIIFSIINVENVLLSRQRTSPTNTFGNIYL